MKDNQIGTWFNRRIACPACTSDRFKTIYQSQYDRSPIRDYLVDFYSPQGTVEFEYLNGATYILCECEECNLVFQQDIPNENFMERLYEHWIDPKLVFIQNQQHEYLEYYSDYAQEIMQIIGYFRQKPSSLSFFDFGMGWAKWSIMAKAFGCDSYGTELSLERIKYAESNGIKIIKFDEIPNNKFDFINTEQVFEHIPKPLQTLCHLKTALKPNGILKISVPPGNDIQRLLKIMDWTAPKGSKNSLNPVAPLEHINCFRRSSIIKMASEAGMEEVSIPMQLQYSYTTSWTNPKKIIKNLLRPIYRNLLAQQNYVFLRNI
jgi:2-polyprenyl-3-methyl-5-hydroxy-6-metoxy-1,4-benzoquinol methylase